VILHGQPLIGHAFFGEDLALAPPLLSHVQHGADAEALQEGGVTGDLLVVVGAGAPE